LSDKAPPRICAQTCVVHVSLWSATLIVNCSFLLACRPRLWHLNPFDDDTASKLCPEFLSGKTGPDALSAPVRAPDNAQAGGARDCLDFPLAGTLQLHLRSRAQKHRVPGRADFGRHG